jgi:preprotein translocase subunit YajC
MEEIKVGEYVRTKNGIIAKVTYVDAMMIDTDNDVFDIGESKMMEIPVEYIEEYVSKHSFNIIDLIEKRRFCYFRI